MTMSETELPSPQQQDPWKTISEFVPVIPTTPKAPYIRPERRKPGMPGYDPEVVRRFKEKKSGKQSGKPNTETQVGNSIDLNPTLGIRYISPEAIPIKRATAYSACFDISACILPTSVVKAYTANCKEINLLTGKEFQDSPYSITIPAHTRAIVPTGFILDIPIGYSFRIYSRSGLSSKRGLVILNGEGIIDTDYVEPVFVILANTTDITHRICHGDRIAQGELVFNCKHTIQVLTHNPAKKSERDGGFGSTGV